MHNGFYAALQRYVVPPAVREIALLRPLPKVLLGGEGYGLHNFSLNSLLLLLVDLSLLARKPQIAAEAIPEIEAASLIGDEVPVPYARQVPDGFLPRQAIHTHALDKYGAQFPSAVILPPHEHAISSRLSSCP